MELVDYIRKINIGIVGYGFVGQGVHASLNREHITTNIFDIKEQYNSVEFKHKELIKKCEVMFVCVNTPVADESALRNVAKSLIKVDYTGIVVVKSTVTFEIFESIFNDTNLKVVFCPEFLEQNTYIEDSENQNHIIIGGEYIYTNQIEKLFKSVSEDITFKHCSIKDAINFKFIRNIYGAYKVIFWEFVQDTTGNSRLMADMLKSIPQSDLSIVGLDGERGYGGACFPKDVENFDIQHTHALTHFLIKSNDILK